MAPVHAPAKVLVTGANGFVAMWTVRTLLEHGYSVRATVRSAQKGEYLKKYFEKYGDKFELVEVKDIAALGAFDEAIKGIYIVAHTVRISSVREYEECSLTIQ